jgi:hypothetical protein
MLGQARFETLRGEGGAVIGAERELARLEPVSSCRAFDQLNRLVGAAAQCELPVDDRDQIDPAVLTGSDAAHVRFGRSGLGSESSHSACDP